MTYYALNTSSVVDFVRNRPATADFFPDGADVVTSEVGDGNLNLVFILENATNDQNSLVVKQALPYLRVAGESWPLTRERMRYETQALLKHNELAPGLAPKVYDSDDEMSVVVMEHLREHEIMRRGLVARKLYPHFADHISTFLVNSLFYTSDLYLTGVEKKLLMAKFVNDPLLYVRPIPHRRREETPHGEIRQRTTPQAPGGLRLQQPVHGVRREQLEPPG